MRESSNLVTGKKRPINRLKSFYPFREIEKQSYLEALQASKEGKPVAWGVASSWQGDIPLRAMDIPIIYPENYASLCAATGNAGAYMELSDLEGYPPNLCGYSRCTIGYAYSMMKERGGNIPPHAPFGGIPKPALLFTSGMKCDTRFKWFQAMGRYFNAPLFCLEMPIMGNYEGTEADLEKYQVKFLVQMLNDYIAFLEKLFGRKMDYAKLDETVDLMAKVHLAGLRISELGKALPGPRHSIDFWGTISPGLFSSGKMEQILVLYDDMLAEVQERVENGVSAINVPERFRLIFADIPPWHSLNFFDGLAERGWNFVYESAVNFHQPQPPDLTGIHDPVEKLARLGRNFYFQRLQNAKDNKVSNYYVDIYLKAAREYRADGFFLHMVASCRPMSQHLRTLQDYLHKRLDVPSLWVEGDMVDRSVFDPQEILARAEAFEQTMEYCRGLRRKKGWDW